MRLWVCLTNIPIHLTTIWSDVLISLIELRPFWFDRLCLQISHIVYLKLHLLLLLLLFFKQSITPLQIVEHHHWYHEADCRDGYYQSHSVHRKGSILGLGEWIALCVEFRPVLWDLSERIQVLGWAWLIAVNAPVDVLTSAILWLLTALQILLAEASVGASANLAPFNCAAVAFFGAPAILPAALKSPLTLGGFLTLFANFEATRAGSVWLKEASGWDLGEILGICLLRLASLI